MIILPSITNGSTGGSYESFPYLPRSIRDNNSFADDFINLPEIGGIPKWTENAPPGWLQYSPYYYVFLKWYLKAKEIDENVADGGGRVHALKVGGIGSSLGLTKERMLTFCPIQGCSQPGSPDFSIYSISQTVSITTENFVNFGCFLKVLDQDPLRQRNIAGIALYFTKGIRRSYFNYSLVQGGDFYISTTLPGNPDSYTYFNTYDASKVYEAYNQWIGQPIIKIKGLAKTNQNSIFNQWQFLNYKIDIPTFDNSDSNPEKDGATGKADSCTMMIFFGENNGYLDDGSGSRSGAVQFLRPFLSLS
jgi:hypothetical protein